LSHRCHPQQAANIDIGEVSVRAAFGGRHSNLGRSRMIVKLDEETLQQLTGVFTSERALGEAALVKREQVLIEVARIEGIPTIQFSDDGQVTEPVGLERFMEISRRIRRNPLADVSDLLQFLASLRTRLSRGEFTSELRVTFSKQDSGGASDIEGPQRLTFVVGQGITAEIESVNGVSYVAFKIKQPFRIDLVIEHRMPGRALLHEFGEHAGAICFFPLRRQFREDPVPHGTSTPEWDDLVPVCGQTFRIHVIMGQRPRVQDFEILHAMARQLWKSGRCFRAGTALANNELVVTKIKALVLAEMKKGARAQHRYGEKTLMSLVELRYEKGSFGRHARPCVEAEGTESSGSFGHTSLSVSIYLKFQI
jgi:hypothetical protein